MLPLGAPACLSRVSAGLAGMIVSVESVPETALPDGGSAVTVAVFATCPTFTSACVSVYGPVHVVCAPGASAETGQDTVPTLGSVIVTLDSVTLPVFVTTN